MRPSKLLLNSRINNTNLNIIFIYMEYKIYYSIQKICYNCAV